MNTEEQSRKLMVQERQQQEHIHDDMLRRAVEAGESLPENITEKARELLAQERLQEEHIQENMLNRSIETLNQ